MSNNENQKPDDLSTNVEGEKVDENNQQAIDPNSIPQEVKTNAQKGAQASNVKPDFAKNTLNESMSRFGATGQIRAAIFAGIGVVTLAAGGLIWALSGDEEAIQAGTVVMPTTDVTASATVTPEQAAHIKAQQEQQADEAAMRGDTYIAAILTEREQQNNLTGNPTQPGLTGKVGSDGSVETPNGKMSASQLAFMQKRGYDQEVVNSARTDGPKNLYGQPVGTPPPNNLQNNDANGNANGQQPPNSFYQVQPYQATQTNGAQSGGPLENENNALTQASDDVNKWQSDYAALRQKKAKAIDEKTQLAFESQVKNLASTKIDRKFDGKNTTYQTLHFRTASQSVDAFGNPIGDLKAGVAFNATAPQTQNIHGNGFVAGESSVDGQAEKKLLVRAGETARAILTTGVNTDEGLEVAAKIQSGTFKGATVLGTVQITNGNIQFRFNRLLRKGVDEIGVDAVARQLGTNKSGMADDIKNHYVQRYTALALSSALSGYGEAYEQTAGQQAEVASSGTVITQSTDPSNDRIFGNVVGELGEELSNEIKKNQNRKPTYLANSGKVFNLFFNQSVYESSVSASVSTNVKR